MPFQQKDIVKVSAPLPDGTITVHPFLIISCETCISHEKKERYYTGIMMTHSGYRDRFSFPVKPEMIDGRWNESWSQIRIHIIVSFRESDIGKNATDYLGKMKKVDFRAVIDNVITYVICID
jgi:hypothetical protein